MDASKSLRLQDLASASKPEELQELGFALRQSNRSAAQLKSSLAAVLERESILQDHNQRLELHISDLEAAQANLRDEVESFRACFDHAKLQLDLANKSERQVDNSEKEEKIAKLEPSLRTLEESLQGEIRKTKKLTEEIGLKDREIEQFSLYEKEAKRRIVDLEELLKRKEKDWTDLNDLIKRKETEYQDIISRLKEQLSDNMRQYKENIQMIEKKVQKVRAEHSRLTNEKNSFIEEISRLHEESERKSEEREHLTQVYEAKLKEVQDNYTEMRERQERSVASLSTLLDKHEELERDYQDAVFHIEELEARLSASEASAKQVEQALDEKNSRLREAITENTLKYEEQLNTSDTHRLRLQSELSKSQTIESERLKERAFYQTAMATLLQLPPIPPEKASELIDALVSIPVEDAPRLIKFIAKIPSMLTESQPERRLRVVLKLTDSTFESPDKNTVTTGEREYRFDQVFREEEKVEAVYEEVAVLADAFVQGMSASVYVFDRSSFMFNNMLHRTLLGLFKSSELELILRVKEGGDQPSYEQRVSSYAMASKVLETAAKTWSQSDGHLVLSLQQASTKQLLSFVNVNTRDKDVVKDMCEALVTSGNGFLLPPHLQECVETTPCGLCILTIEAEDGQDILELGEKLMENRFLENNTH